MKKCTKCGEFKPLSCFNKDRSKSDGLNYYCTQCRVKNNKKYKKYFDQYRKNNKESQKEYRNGLKKKYGIGLRTVNTYGLKLALLVYDRAGRKCEECGEINDLTIHHKDGNGRHNQEKGLPMNNEPDNLQVLCRSCHGRLHSREYWQSKK